jgi:predicted SprT family Zn-dependent metalloprotease
LQLIPLNLEFVLHNTTMKPTDDTYSGLQQAFDKFNRELFEDKLPSCLLTLQREKSTCGYFSANRFAHSTGYLAHEIAMNPAYFGVVPLVEVMQTLVHEMAHLWQFHYGKPARGRYHNAEWADKMEAIGLMPSSTGSPGGARTGDRMADYAIKRGRFLAVCEELMAVKFRLSWYDRFPPKQVKAAAQQLYVVKNEDAFSEISAEASQLPQIATEERERLSAPKPDAETASAPPPKKATREKYVCSCDNAVWGRPNLKIRCEECHQLFDLQVVAQSEA